MTMYETRVFYWNSEVSQVSPHSSSAGQQFAAVQLFYSEEEEK
jgi:hypothetical protein